MNKKDIAISIGGVLVTGALSVFLYKKSAANTQAAPAQDTSVQSQGTQYGGVANLSQEGGTVGTKTAISTPASTDTSSSLISGVLSSFSPTGDSSSPSNPFDLHPGSTDIGPSHIPSASAHPILAQAMQTAQPSISPSPSPASPEPLAPHFQRPSRGGPSTQRGRYQNVL